RRGDDGSGVEFHGPGGVASLGWRDRAARGKGSRASGARGAGRFSPFARGGGPLCRHVSRRRGLLRSRHTLTTARTPAIHACSARCDTPDTIMILLLYQLSYAALHSGRAGGGRAPDGRGAPPGCQGRRALAGAALACRLLLGLGVRRRGRRLGGDACLFLGANAEDAHQLAPELALAEPRLEDAA